MAGPKEAAKGLFDAMLTACQKGSLSQDQVSHCVAHKVSGILDLDERMETGDLFREIEKRLDVFELVRLVGDYAVFGPRAEETLTEGKWETV